MTPGHPDLRGSCLPVVFSHAVAERYRDEGHSFSSAGRSPVASIVGLTVLDVIRDEGLQADAARVGAHLKARRGAGRRELIGVVHGSELYSGVEFVRTAARRSLPPRGPRPYATACSRTTVSPEEEILNLYYGTRSGALSMLIDAPPGAPL